MPAPALERTTAAASNGAANGGAAKPLRKASELDASRRARMLSSAVEIFFAEGYHASMDHIASRARVAKQTVYNHFGCKERLFAEVVQHLADTIIVPLGEPGLDVRTALIRFSLALRARVLSAQGIGAHRALVAEAPRFPDLAHLVYVKGHQSALDTLAEFVEIRTFTGELACREPRFAAQMLLGMLTGHDRVRLLYGIKSDAGRESEVRRCERIVDCFLNAFGAKPDASGVKSASPGASKSRRTASSPPHPARPGRGK